MCVCVRVYGNMSVTIYANSEIERLHYANGVHVDVHGSNIRIV